jgi:small subunit ribosomal protein S35
VLTVLLELAKPFVPPKEGEVLRFRYTSYQGEDHPAQHKVVLQVSPFDLNLTDAQRLKMIKLAGARYNPDTRIMKFNCEMFNTQAQNKRYLADQLEKLIAESKVCICGMGKSGL